MQGSLRCFADGTNQGLFTSAAQAINKAALENCPDAKIIQLGVSIQLFGDHTDVFQSP